MTRVAFMNDRWLRALGLDGRATIPSSADSPVPSPPS